MSRSDPPRHPWRIDDVLARTDLAALLDELAEPATHHFRGRRWHCPLPEHDDRNASVTMHTDHRGHERWRCWSGDNTHRGDAIDLVAVTQRRTRGEAIDWLASRAGMIADHPLPPARKKPPRTTVDRLVPLDPAVARYATACERILWGNTGEPVRHWLHERGFSDDLIRANHIGADPGRHMMRRRSGLPYGHGLAAVLPALDHHGQLRYLQTRYLEPGDGPKYDNPAARLGSNSRLAWTRTTGEPVTGTLIVCEGIPDALTAAQAGYRSAGILGSQAPDDAVATALASAARRLDARLIAIIDHDDAGRTWGQRLSDLLEQHGQNIEIVEPPAPGLDLNAWALQGTDWSKTLLAGVSANFTPDCPTMHTGIEP